MKTTLTRTCAALFAAGAVWFAAAPAARAETNVRDPDDPTELLTYAEGQAEILKAKAAKKQIPGREYRKFAAKLDQFRNWYNCAQMDPQWEPGKPVMLRLSASDFNFTEGAIGPDVGLSADIETVVAVLPGTQSAVHVGYGAKNPVTPGFAVYYLLGTYTNNVVLVAPGSGYWKGLSDAEFTSLCFNAKAAGGSAEVDRQQFNGMLVAIYKELFGQPPAVNWIPYAVAGGIALLVVLLALILAFRRKKEVPPVIVPTCRDCGAPLGPDGRCPSGCDDRVPEPGPSDPGPAPGPVEKCPNCGSELADGVCPKGCTIVRCPHCDSIMKNGVCPVCGELEICPSCGSELVDGVCPNGCTIVRCPDCGKIMLNGVCPKGCNAKALSLGWSGSAKPTFTPWKLEVVAPAKHASETCELPFEVVIGRSASERKTTETYIQLHFENKRAASGCSRRYVKLVADPGTKEVSVELLSTSGRAVVDGKTLASAGDKAPLPEGGTLELSNAGYKLRLVRA